MKNFLQVNRASTGAKKNFRLVNRALRAKKNFYFNFKHLLVLSAVLLLGSTQVWGETVDCSGASATSGSGYTNKSTSTNYTVYFSRGGGGWSFNSGYGYQGKTDAIAVFELLVPTNVYVIVSNIDNSKARAVEVTAKPFKTVALGEEFLSILEVSYSKPAKYADCVSSSKNYAKVATTSAFYNTNHSTMCTLSNTQLSTSVSYSTGEKSIATNTTGVRYSLGILPAGVYAAGFTTAGNSNVTLAGFEFSPANPTFSVSADAELTAEEDAVTLTSAGNTVYYKWSTNSSAYAANAGATLAGATDGSGTSPVDATAPAGTGTYYLYAVAKNGTYYSDVVKRSYTIVAPAPATTCADAYSFHYGPNGGSWETPICFTQVGETHEWNIENFTIPSHANGEFWVGYAGSTNGQSVTKRWTDGLSDTGSGIMNGAMVLLPTNGSIVGQASGATGTLSIWDDSESKNQYVGFKPDGYAIMYGGNNYAFSETATSNVWETDLLTLPDVSTTYQVGIKTSSSYTTCSHSKSAEALSTPGNTTLKDGKKYIYLNAGVWRTNAEGRPDDVNEKMAVWDATNVSGEWGNGGNFLTYNKATGLYEGYVSSSTTKIVLTRINNGRASLGNTWGDGVYNQTYDITLTATNNEFTITAWHDNNDDKKPSTHTAAPHSHPATGDNGKFRMYDNSNDANWYVHWIPYYKLSYDGNGGTGSVAAQYRNSELSTSPLSVAGNGFTREGWRFAGWNTNKYGTGTDYAPGDNIDITGDQTLYAKWERDIYLQSDVSWWYNDNAWFAVYCFDSEHDTNYKWVSMTRAEECSSPAVYKVALPGNNFDKVIFVRMNKNKASLEWASKDNQTTDITYPDLAEDEDLFTISNGDDGNACTGTWGTYSVPTFTISYNAGTGGSGSRGNDSKSCNVAFTLPGVVFTRTGYTQTGWTTSDGGSQTHALGGSYTTNDDQTFYPVWSQIMVSSVALNKANTTITEGGTETLTATVLPATALDKTVTWTTSDGDVATVDDGVVTAVGVGSATITATAHDGSGVYAECAITVEEAASCSGDPTALESGELYTIDEMVSNCSATAISSTTSGDPGIYQYGLSSNGKFYIVGTTNGDNASTGTVEMKKLNNDGSSTTVGDASITYVAWLKGEGSTSCRSIKFVIPTRGVLTVYGKGGGTGSGKGNVQILENSTGTVTEVIAKSSNSACKSSEIAVNAGIYYIYSSGASAAIYGLRFEEITVPNVSGLGVDDGATLSSIPLSWKIPGICDLSKPVKATMSEVNSNTQETPAYNPSDSTVTAVGSAGLCSQYGIAFSIPEETNVTSVTADWKINSGNLGLFAAIINSSDGKTYWEHNNYYYDNDIWNRSTYTINSKYWTDGGGGYSLPTSVQYVGVFANDPGYGGFTNASFSLRDLRYHVSGREDIDHVVLMRKEGSAATDTADASATRLYSGTKSHYTDVSDVTGKNYYYTVFAVHASGAVSTGVSTSLTLYTITYSAGAHGSGTVAAGKKTHGINFTLSSSKFTRDGYTQDGWSTSDGGDKIYELGATYSTDAALTLYPHWVAVSGPVITNGSPANGSIAVTSDGSTPILSAVTGSTVYIAATPSTGYNFTSWDVYKTDESGTKVSLAGSTASTSFIMPSYAVTVNASFAAKTYTVTLNGNGGTGNTANVTATYGSSSFSSSITNPTKTGYIFGGWYSGSGGTGSLIINSSGVLQSSTTYSDGSGNWTNDGAVTLYAKWTRDVKTAGWGAPWGGTAIPNATTSTVNSVTLNACNSTKGALWEKESYTMGNGDSVTINLASGYYISAVSTAALFDEYGGNTNKLYIQFNSQSTYTNSKYDLDDPITLGDDCYKAFGDISTAPLTSVSPISFGAQSAKIYCKGNSADGNYLYRIVVEIKAWDCTPSSTITFAAGTGTGTAPQARKFCGTLTLPDEGGLSKEGYNFAGWNDGEATYFTGETYEVTEDVTFTAQWRDMETPLIIPTVTQLNATNYHYAPAFTKYDVDGSGAIKCINIEGQDSVDWKFKITPGYYSISIAYGAPSGLSTDVTAKIYEVGDVSDKFDRLVMSESFTTGSSDARTRLCSKIFKLNLDEDKTYRIVVKDTYGDDSSHPCVGYINFTPLSSPMTIADDESLTYSNVVASPGTVVFDVEDDGNDVTCLNLEDQNMAEWFAYITPNTYTIKMLYGTAAWSTNLTFSIIDPTDGTSVYAPSAVTKSNGETHWDEEYTWSDVDLTGVSDSKPYIIRVKDTYGSKGSRPKIAHIDFIPTKYDLAWSSNGGNALTGDYTSGDVAAGVAITAPDDPTRTGYDFVKWNSADDGSGNDFNTKMPMKDVTYYAQWEIIDYTIAHSDATNGSYTIKVGDASAVSTNTTGNYNQTVTLVATPSSGYVIDGWNVSGATVGNNNIASTTFTMPAGNVTVAPTFKLMPNVYYYQDGTRYASSTYKTPDGSTATSKDNQSINSGDEWTVSNSISGLTVSAKGCTYDGKSGSEIHITSYLKVPKDGNASNQYVKFVVASGYKATSLKMKIGGYSSNPAVTLKPYVSSSLGDAINYSGTIGGVATTENNFNEISWSNLAAGTYYLNVGTNNAYISEITAQTEQVGYTVSFAVDGGSTGYGTVSPSSITEVTHGSTVSISENVLTLKETAVTATPTDESDEYTYAFDSWSVSDGASITSAQTITASFTRTAKEYTLTWNLNGGKVSTAGTAAAVDETEPSGSVAYNTALTAPVVTKSGYDFAGWTPSVADNMPAANTTYTAQWAEQFTVTYNAMTGSVDPTSGTGSTANKVSLPEPTKDGYDFDGWYNTAGEKIGDAGDKYGPTAAITLYAKWKGECAGGGGGSTTKEVYFCKSTDNPGTQSEIFTGAPTDGGNLDPANQSFTVDGVDYGPLTRRTSNTTHSISFTLASDKTARLWAVHNQSARHFTLTGSSSGSIDLVSSSTGFSTEGSVYADVFDISSAETYTLTNTENIGLICLILKITDGSGSSCYTVTYHGNNATSGYVNDPEQYAAGSSVSAKYNSAIDGFARTGYEFVEWNTAADGSGDAYKPFARITSSIDDDIDLYAQWRIVIDANNTDFAGKDDPTQYRDVKVTKGATLTLTQNTAVRDIIVETGSTLNVSTNSGDPITLSTRSLSLVGGWGTVGEETKYDMPRVFINSASKITKTTKTINFDIAVDNRNFYPIAVPFPVTVSDVDYVNATLAYYSNYGTSGQYVIKTYNGQARANADMSNCWRVMRDGEKHYLTSPGEASEVMVPGQGYILRALPASGYGDYAVIRFPMKNVDDEWTNGGEKGSITVKVEEEDVTTTKNAVSVVAYENNSGGDTKLSNKGWNILGVPYMTCFVSNEIESDETNAYIKGLLNITTGEYTEDGNVYVTVPKHDFSEYDQLNFSEAKLLPGWCFFVQMDKDATLTFDKDGERASAPFRATMYEQKPTVKTGIILSGAEASDKTTILVSDKYSAADYEINADLEKMFGENSYTLATYSLMGETRLAYNAMSNSDATNVIPIGYRAPADGEYTFAINPRYAENGAFEHVNLIDYETGFVTDLLLSSYSFATERTQNDERFALNVVKAPQTATDITVTGDGLQVTGPQKVIINDKLYIIVDGKMYSAEGALVK